jgi:hypothetical protein
VSDPESVKRALARLAARSTGVATRTAARFAADRPSDYRTVIDRASAAVRELSVAANFAESTGTDRLERAIDAAEAAGDYAAARRGQRALSAFEQVREAIDGDPDHFRSGRGTPLGGGDEGAGK